MTEAGKDAIEALKERVAELEAKLAESETTSDRVRELYISQAKRFAAAVEALKVVMDTCAHDAGYDECVSCQGGYAALEEASKQ